MVTLPQLCLMVILPVVVIMLVDIVVKIVKAEKRLRDEQEFIKSQKELAECLDRWLTKNETKKRTVHTPDAKNKKTVYTVSKTGRVYYLSKKMNARQVKLSTKRGMIFNNLQEAKAMARQIRLENKKNGTRS